MKNNLMIFILFFLVFLYPNIVNSQNIDDAKKEIILLIKSEFLDFPTMEKKPINIESVYIKSNDLRNLFHKYRVETIRKCFPDFLESDTIRTVFDGTKIRIPPFARIFVIKLNSENHVDKLMAKLNIQHEVGYAEKNYTETIHSSGDPKYNKQWYLHNIGQWGGVL